jgi:Coiled-coil domain-containing protein 55 (DUF2040)
MNISLSKAGKTKGSGKSSSLGYGLNSRKDNTGSGAGANKNVFDDESDEDSNEGSNGGNADDDNNKDGRRIVNQQIAREQAALRRRAQAALQSVEDPTVYDYDGAYETYNGKNDDGEGTSGSAKSEPKQSRYIGDLLKAAKTRERERDAIYERKVAQEQAVEDAQEEYQGKEKFVTNAYKRKLEERKQWETEQEQKDREEEANDVTKKSANAAFASFYSNLNQVQRGGEQSGEKVPPRRKAGDDGDDDDDFDPRQGDGMGFLGGFEQPSAGKEQNDTIKDGKQGYPNLKTTIPGESASADGPRNVLDTPLTMRQLREKKVAEARVRYFQRQQAKLQ